VVEVIIVFAGRHEHVVEVPGEKRSEVARIEERERNVMVDQTPGPLPRRAGSYGVGGLGLVHDRYNPPLDFLSERSVTSVGGVFRRDIRAQPIHCVRLAYANMGDREYAVLARVKFYTAH
jgi:hypothetical protein